MAQPVTIRQDSFDKWRLDTNQISLNLGDPNDLFKVDGAQNTQNGDSTGIVAITTTNAGGSASPVQSILVDTINNLNRDKVKRSGDTITGSLRIDNKLHVGSSTFYDATTHTYKNVATTITASTAGTTLSLFDTNVTTVDAFSAGTAITMGALTGTFRIDNADTKLTGDLTVEGADVTLSKTGGSTTQNVVSGIAGSTVNLLETTNTTNLNLGAAANSIVIGNKTGVQTVEISKGAISGATKTVNIGTGGIAVASSQTNINIGDSTGDITIKLGHGATASVGAVAANKSLEISTGNIIGLSGVVATNDVSIATGNIGDYAKTTINIGTGSIASLSDTTQKTINIGTGGLAGGGATNITIGSSLTNQTIKIADGAVEASKAKVVEIAKGGVSSSTVSINETTGTSTTNIGSGATATGTTKTIDIGRNAVAGSTTTIYLGDSPSTQNINIGTGAVSASTKTINLGTGGSAVASSTTNITIGNSTGVINLYQANGDTASVGTVVGARLVKIASGTTTGLSGFVATSQVDISSGNLGSFSTGTTNIGVGTIANGSTKVISIGTGSTGSTDGSTTLNIGSTATTLNANFAVGGTVAGSTKTINLGTGGLTGSTTNINIGESAGAKTLNIGTGAGSNTINIGTGSSGDSDISIGSNTTGSTLTISNKIQTFNATTEINLNSATIKTNATSLSLFDNVTTTATLFALGTSVTLGSTSTGTFKINNDTVVGNATTQNLWNTTATTINGFGAATSVTLGAPAAGSFRINNDVTSLRGDLFVDGADVTLSTTGGSTTQKISSGIAASTVQLFDTSNSQVIDFASNSTTINIGKTTATGTFAINIGTGTSTAGTKTIKIGTGSTGGVTAIELGSTTASGTALINSPISTIKGRLTITGESFATAGESVIGIGSTGRTTQRIVSDIGSSTAYIFDSSNTTTANIASNATSITLGSMSNAQTVNIGTGSITTAVTKTLNIGTGGSTPSTTNINVGNSTGNIAVQLATGNMVGTSGVVSTNAVSIATGNIGDYAKTTINIGTGSIASLSDTTQKTINIGTGGLAGGGATNIILGSSVANQTIKIADGAVEASKSKVVEIAKGGVSTVTATVNETTGTSTTNIGSGATATGTTKTIDIGRNAVAGSTTTIYLGDSPSTQNINIGTGAVSGYTKSVSIGTGGSAVASSTTNITIGDSTGVINLYQANGNTASVGTVIGSRLVKIASGTTTGLTGFVATSQVDISSGNLGSFSTGTTNIGVGTIATGSTKTINIGTGSSATTDGSTTLNIGSTATNLNVNFAIGGTVAGFTKTINFGTGGLTTSTTNINIGDSAGAKTLNIGTGAGSNVINIGTGSTVDSDISIGSNVIGSTLTVSNKIQSFNAATEINLNSATIKTNATSLSLFDNATLHKSSTYISATSIEFGTSAAKNTGFITASVTANSNTVTLAAGSTANLVIGQLLSKTGGLGVFGSDARVATITSATTFTTTVNHTTSGIINFDTVASQFKINNDTVVGNATTQNLWNTTATTINGFGAATSVTLGAPAAGSFRINNDVTSLRGDLFVDGADVTLSTTGGSTTQKISSGITGSTVQLFDTSNSQTIDFASNSTTINIGKTTATGAFAINIGTGITTANTKTIKIGTGSTGGVTAIELGSTTASGTALINSPISTIKGRLTITGESFATAGESVIGLGVAGRTTQRIVSDIASSTAYIFDSSDTITANIASNAGTITLGSRISAQTVNIGTGSITTAVTKTVNIGTGGGSSSTTNINVGNSTAIQSIKIGDGATVAVLNQSASITSGTNTVIVTSTAGYQVGMKLVTLTGPGAFGNNATIASITNATTFTTSVNHTTTGSITFDCSHIKTIEIGKNGASGSTTSISIGESAGAKTLNIGTGTGSNAINIGTGSSSDSDISLGSNTTGSTLTVSNKIQTFNAATEINLNSATIKTDATTLSLFDNATTTATLFALGADITVGATTGTIKLKNANIELSGVTKVLDTTDSTSTADGALIVSGGVGIANALNVGGITEVLDTTDSTTTGTGALIVSGGVGIAKNLTVGGAIIMAGTVGTGTALNDVVTFSNQSRIINTTITTTSVTKTTLCTAELASYTSFDIMIQAKEGTNIQTVKLLVNHDGTNTYNTEYANIGSANVATYDVLVSAENLIVTVEAANASSTVFKLVATAL